MAGHGLSPDENYSPSNTKDYKYCNYMWEAVQVISPHEHMENFYISLKSVPNEWELGSIYHVNPTDIPDDVYYSVELRHCKYRTIKVVGCGGAVSSAIQSAIDLAS